MKKKGARKQASEPMADLVRRLATATGLSLPGVYKCLRLKRRPHNPLVAAEWDRVIACEGGVS